jgi:hypothetical protein
MISKEAGNFLTQQLTHQNMRRLIEEAEKKKPSTDGRITREIDVLKLKSR